MVLVIMPALRSSALATSASLMQYLASAARSSSLPFHMSQMSPASTSSLHSSTHASPSTMRSTRGTPTLSSKRTSSLLLLRHRRSCCAAALSELPALSEKFLNR